MALPGGFDKGDEAIWEGQSLPQQRVIVVGPAKRAGVQKVSVSVKFPGGSHQDVRIQSLKKIVSAPSPSYDAAPSTPMQAWGSGIGTPQNLRRKGARERPGAFFRRHKQQVLDLFKQTVMKHVGVAGIAGLGRIFCIMDHDRSGSLDADELKAGLIRYGLPLDDEDIETLIDVVDNDGNGTIDYNEFLRALRGDLSARREQMIWMAFDVMDKDGSGVIDVGHAINVFNASQNPDVISGRVSEEECLKQFLGHFEGVEKDGVVTRDEWIEYYRNVSASIDEDDYFELMMRNTWHITGGEGWCEEY